VTNYISSSRKRSEGLELQTLTRKRLRELTSDRNLEIYPREYTYNYKKLGVTIGRNKPRCDIAISSDENLFLIEIDTGGMPTFNAAKVWFYLRHDGRFDERGKPKRVTLLHFVRMGKSEYDVQIAQELASEIEKVAQIKLKEHGVCLRYIIERFDYGERSVEDVANYLSNKIIDKIKNEII
jgi:hypothetical protein